MKHFVVLVLGIVVAVILPFVVVVRGAITLYEMYAMNLWLALLGGALIALVLLFIYGILILKFVLKDESTSAAEAKVIVFVSVLLIGAYTGHGLFTISESTAKNDEVVAEYDSVHPILLLAVNTLTYVDGELVLTDISRAHADYQKMGLQGNSRSLHYPQSDGYVYAVDLRTLGKNEIRNRLVHGYFWLMGFNTLRHDGTADHLHISLRSPDNPTVI